MPGPKQSPLLPPTQVPFHLPEGLSDQTVCPESYSACYETSCLTLENLNLSICEMGPTQHECGDETVPVRATTLLVLTFLLSEA